MLSISASENPFSPDDCNTTCLAFATASSKRSFSLTVPPSRVLNGLLSAASMFPNPRCVSETLPPTHPMLRATENTMSKCCFCDSPTT